MRFKQKKPVEEAVPAALALEDKRAVFQKLFRRGLEHKEFAPVELVEPGMSDAEIRDSRLFKGAAKLSLYSSLGGIACFVGAVSLGHLSQELALAGFYGWAAGVVGGVAGFGLMVYAGVVKPVARAAADSFRNGFKRA